MQAQGSLEYLVIIAAVLAIAGITAVFLSGVLSGQSSQVSVAACKQASETCKLSQMSSPNDPCISCNAACQNPSTKKEIFVGAVYCCNHTRSDIIYSNSSECAALVCHNNQLDPGEECDANFDSACPGHCVDCKCYVCGNNRLDPGEPCEGSILGTCTGTGAYCSNCECHCSDGTKAGQCSTVAIGGLRCSASGSLVPDVTCPCPTCYTFSSTMGCIYTPNCGAACCSSGQVCCGSGIAAHCCSSGQICCNSMCYSSGQCCGGLTYCPTGTCIGTTCCLSGIACGTTCCSSGQSCSSCPYGGSRCCASGGSCCGTGTGGTICCSSGQSCTSCGVGNKCCAFGTYCKLCTDLSTICCLSAQSCMTNFFTGGHYCG